MTPPIVVRGDARRLPLPDASVDCIVTDPPYELTAGKKGGTGPASLNLASPAGRSRISTGGGFMGKSWDATGVAFDPATWVEALRVAKPGAHLLAFGGTRTYHRLACAIEDAGWEIRDSIGCLTWCYASGFPKSLDVSKAIDKMAGAEREVIGRYVVPADSDSGSAGKVIRSVGADGGFSGGITAGRLGTPITASATEDAARWQGWGTALKPAWEPIVVARKPLAGSVAANVLAYGTGALNVDVCRVEMDDGDRAVVDKRSGSDDGQRDGIYHNGVGRRAVGERFTSNPAGRWPPNLLIVHHPDCATRCVTGCHVAELDTQAGVRTSGLYQPHHADNGKTAGTYGAMTGRARSAATYGDSGSASRFYPVFRFEPKADTAERPTITRDGADQAHATVKPVDLMRWLIRLVTPPGGLLLDQFAGSGATLQGAQVEGVRSVGVELDAEGYHIDLIRERLSWPVRVDREGRFERLRPQPVPEGQYDLFG